MLEQDSGDVLAVATYRAAAQALDPQPAVPSSLQPDRLLVDSVAVAENQRADRGAVRRYAKFLHAAIQLISNAGVKRALG
ncbi:MAG: hypothetical protein ACRYF2_17100 [Janthinobacterium lividum]